jgi:hypothetical protein
MVQQEQFIHSTLELNLPNTGLFAHHQRPRPITASIWFAERFPEQAERFGAPFVEVREALELDLGLEGRGKLRYRRPGEIRCIHECARVR